MNEALVELNNGLDRLNGSVSVDEEGGWNDGNENADSEPGIVDVAVQSSEPRGHIEGGIEVNCFVAVISERLIVFSVSFVEYIGSKSLAFEYKIDYNDSGGVQVFNIVCNENGLCTNLRKIFNFAKKVTVSQTVDGAGDDDGLLMHVRSRKCSSQWTPVDVRTSNKIVSVAKQPPPIRRKFNREIWNNCQHIDMFIRHIDRISPHLQTGNFETASPLPPGPATSPPP